jgi:peptidoglycan/xylan/chitin deacetylase (PgdA/CDA1 family)
MRLKLPKWLLISICVLGSACAFAQTPRRQVVITIDDLPYAGVPNCNPQEVIENTKKLLEPIRAARVPAVGFVIAERCKQLSVEQKREILQLWLDAGVELGNHTWSHPDFNSTTLEEYGKQILATDDYLRNTIHLSKLSYFRAPYLHDGATPESRKQLRSFLAQHGYQEAPVTLDNNEWIFAAAYNRALNRNDMVLAESIEKAYIPYMESTVAFFEKRSVEVLGRECPQVLLIHANSLNAKTMGPLLQMFRERGYTFITLEQALRDPAYRLADSYVGPKGMSWIHRWGVTKGQPIQAEPQVPEWVGKAAGQSGQ